MDMRTKIRFPRPPSSMAEIYNPGVPAWHLACALVGQYDSFSHNTFRKYWALLGDDRFRDILDGARIILSESRNIRSPGAFLNTEFAAALGLSQGGL